MVIKDLNAPIVVSYGGGTNSTAILILLKRKGLRPTLIMFADTGDENPHTYKHLDVMQAWCRTNGFPEITVVRNQLPQGIKDGSLYGECLRLGTLPAKVFGGSSCSVKWKVEPQNKYLKKWMAENGASYVRHLIGFDADEIHRSQKAGTLAGAAARADTESTEYPLIEAGWGRDECVQAIDEEGLPRPGKSACFMCPSSRKPEVVALSKKYPVLYMKAVALERRALAGEGQAPAAQVKGLGRHWNWETLEGVDVASEVDCGCYDGESATEETLW